MMEQGLKPIMICPSMLAADAGALAACARRAEEWGADALHIDVMDGSFVADFGFAPREVAAIRRVVKLPLDVHLMTREPARHIAAFADAGASSIVFQIEAEAHVDKTLNLAKKTGVAAGVALAPGTPLQALQYIMAECDLITIMAINPGMAGSSFIPYIYRKIGDLAALLEQCGAPAQICVDGGIGMEQAQKCLQAGAVRLIAGTSIFHSPHPAAVIRQMRGRG